jgi:hypothetical protein
MRYSRKWAGVRIILERAWVYPFSSNKESATSNKYDYPKDNERADIKEKTLKLKLLSGYIKQANK